MILGDCYGSRSTGTRIPILMWGIDEQNAYEGTSRTELYHAKYFALSFFEYLSERLRSH
jgi:hypothetical protein